MHRRKLMAAVFACALVGIKALAGSTEPDRHLIKTGARFGYINHLGEIVIPPKFEEAHAFFKGLAAVKIGNRWGNIDETGKMVVPAKYKAPLYFHDGIAFIERVQGQSRYHELIDQHGRIIVPRVPGLEPVHYSGGFLEAPWRGGYLDKNGRLALKARPEWEDWTDFSDGLAAVQLKGLWGFINKQGRLVIPAKFDPPISYELGIPCFAGQKHHDALSFSEKLSPVGVGGKAGFIDWTGAFVIAPQFDAALPFSDGLARVRMNGKWGFVDHSGKMIIAPKFGLVGPFKDGRAATMEKEQWGFIDKKGENIIPLQYQGAWEFTAGLAAVQISTTHWIYIDKQGKKVAAAAPPR